LSNNAWDPNPVDLQVTDTYLSLSIAPTNGQGVAIITRVDKFKGCEEYLVYDGVTEEVFQVRQLVENRVAHLQAMARATVAVAPAQKPRSRKRARA